MDIFMSLDKYVQTYRAFLENKAYSLLKIRSVFILTNMIMILHDPKCKISFSKEKNLKKVTFSK